MRTLALALLSAFLSVAPARAAQSEIHAWSGDSLCRSFGRGLSGSGDLSGDGVADVLVGAPGCGQQSSFVTGAIHVHDGLTGARMYTVWGQNRADQFGRSVEALGDVDGDGLSDFCGSSFPITPVVPPSYVAVFSGASGAPLYTLSPPQANDAFGTALAAVDDVDGDQVADLLVGAQWDPPSGFLVHAGSATLYSGADGRLLYRRYGAVDYDLFGAAVANLGDVDGDGAGDFLVGSPMGELRAGPGAVYLYSGRSGGLLRVQLGNAVGDRFGHALAGVGDVSGDGRPDYLVGSNTYPAGAGIGAAWLYSGADGTLLRSIDGASPGEGMGFHLGGGSDLDGDGVTDYFVTALSDENENDAGSVRVYSGAGGELLYTVFGHTRSAQLGRAADVCGDLNGDQRDDLLVGSAGESVEGVKVGRAWAISGWDDGPVLTVRNHAAGATAEAEVRWAQAGSTIWVAWSVAGNGPTQTPLGEVALTRPVHRLAPLTADPSGQASAALPVPAWAGGVHVFAQAAESRASGWRLSNPVWLIVR